MGVNGVRGERGESMVGDRSFCNKRGLWISDKCECCIVSARECLICVRAKGVPGWESRTGG